MNQHYSLFDAILEPTWRAVLKQELEQPYITQIKKYLANEIAQGYTIYPKGEHILNALNTTPFNKVKVVLLGQDPYHQPNQAHGLSFSVLEPTQPPPSLRNIFKELQTDLNMPIPNHGNLTNWAKQGVLLLNTSLTVKATEPMSHSHIGWQQFTHFIINQINAQHTNIVFILWGKFAQQTKQYINTQKHLVLEAAHPSPLSAYNGFWGCKHFSSTNNYLQANGIEGINWQLD